MKTFSLNCQGLGILEVVQELHCLVSKEGPRVLFFSETKLDMNGFAGLKSKLDLTKRMLEPLRHITLMLL